MAAPAPVPAGVRDGEAATSAPTLYDPAVKLDDIKLAWIKAMAKIPEPVIYDLAHQKHGVDHTKKTPAGLSHALDIVQVRVRYNLRSHQIERGEAEVMERRVWRPFNDSTRSQLRALVNELNGAPVWGRDAFNDALWAIAGNFQRDPLDEYLYSLPKWDGEERFWICDLFGAEGRLPKWASLIIPMVAVQRCCEPGYRMKQTPVLIGAQGIGKSPALAHLLPADMREQGFSDGLHLAAPEKERGEALQGRTIVEISEMAGSNRADLEAIKAFLSRSDDGYFRRAYRRDPSPSPRRAALVGTANIGSSPLPNDPSGNQRFVAVDCKRGSDVESYMRRNREQIWAESLYKTMILGQRPKMPRHWQAEQSEANEPHRHRDEFLEDKIEAIDRIDRGGATEPPCSPETGWSTRRIAREVELLPLNDEGKQLTARDQARLARALRNMGWELTPGKVMRRGERTRRWYNSTPQRD